VHSELADVVDHMRKRRTMSIVSCRQLAAPIVLVVAALLGVQISFASIARAENEVLEHALELRQDQSGFAGVSVKLITIEPDGSWLEEHYLITDPSRNLKDQKRTKHDGGKLSKSEIEGLKARLESAEFKTLGSGPVKENLGSSESQVSISYGPRKISRISSSFDNKSGATTDHILELAKSIQESISKQTE